MKIFVQEISVLVVGFDEEHHTVLSALGIEGYRGHRGCVRV
jgi:hypothetical protein